MARSALSGRLGRIREAQKRSAVAALESDAPAAKKKVCTNKEIPGWRETAPDLFERERTIRIPQYHGRFSGHLPLLFPRERIALERCLAASGPNSVPKGSVPPFHGSLIFFDLETTGLSHGAGTVAFMASLASFTRPGELEIKQLLIADYPGEAAFLGRFAELAGSDSVLVSFNGKCFDTQILTTRYLMNGMRPRFLSSGMTHLDLLFPSRRLWKAELGSCRMTDIEEGILGFSRVDDLPGSEAPDAWFDFLRTGTVARLLAVGDHNREDTASLARILFALDKAIESGEGRASLVRALDLRSRGEYSRAAEFLLPLASSGDRTASRILAIDCEHRLGDLDRALALAASIGDEGRSARIKRKLSRRNALTP